MRTSSRSSLFVALAVGLAGCSGGTVDSSGGQGDATANFGLAPAEYVLTPHGYFHPSCVVEVSADEEQHEGGIIAKVDGTTRVVQPCRFPHYDRHGNAIQPDQVVTQQQQQVHADAVKAGGGSTLPDVNGWVESSSNDSHGAMQWISANFSVPSSPTIDGGQTIYYFPGLEDINDVQTIQQPVLGWTGGQWTIASWNCCKDGNVTHSALTKVNPGDYLYGYAYGVNCDGNGQCPNWTVYTQDQTNNASTTLNTSSFGQVFNWSFGGVLEAYGVKHCAQYPASGSVTFSNIVVSQVGGNAVDIDWPSGQGSGTPECGYSYSGGDHGVLGSVTVATLATTMYKPNGATSCGQLSAGQGLVVGQTLTSCDGRFSLTLQFDGNLVLYQAGKALWATGTSGSNGYAALQQSDGNFVLYDLQGHALWAAGTWPHPGNVFKLQNDGNLVVYNTQGTALWASNTCCR